MKATIDFDDQLYRRLKVEAARRGRTVRELVTDGVRHVLDTPQRESADADRVVDASAWRPAWFGALERQARAVNDHSMEAVRASIARGRASSTAKAPSRAPRVAPPRATKRPN